MTQPGSDAENEPKPEQPGEDDVIVDGELDDEATDDATKEAIAAEAGAGAPEEEEEFDFSTAPAPRSRVKPPVKKADPSHSLKATAVPILITVGVALMIPGMWAVLRLSGAEWVWSYSRENSRAMAFVMLMCWPIAIILFGGAWIFYRQIQAEKAALLPPADLGVQTPPAVPPMPKPTPQPSPTPQPKK